MRPARPTGPLLVALAALLALALPGAPARERGEAHEHAPSDYFAAQRGFADDPHAAARLAEARATLLFERSLARRWGAASEPPPWQPLGPFNVGGRVTALAVGPNAAYLGAADGGVWKSTDDGVHWANVSDIVGLASIGALALDPAHPETLWCGTGEANVSGDSYDGDGLWRSADGGASWSHVGLAATARIARVVVDPGDPQHVLVAAQGTIFTAGPDRGLYRTLDGGANWSKVLFVNDSTGANDVVVNPAHPDTMWCSTWERVRRPNYRRASGPGSGIWRSLDRGATWARVTAGLPPADDQLGRIALAVAPSRPGVVYAQVIGGDASGYAGLGLYRSTDGGTTWSRRDAGSLFRDNFGGFGWYFGDVAVDPANSDHVFSLGVNLLESADGGVTWSTAVGLHPDQHALWIEPPPGTRRLLGGDGGVYRGATGNPWTHSTDLPVTQFYAGDLHPTSFSLLYGGTQDNYSLMTSSGPANWTSILDGDGFYTLVDPVTPNVVFSEWQNCCSGAGFRRSTSGGPGGAVTAGWNALDRWNWSTPIAISPRNHNVLLSGSQYPYRSVDNGVTWTKTSAQDLSTHPVASLVYGTISTVAISGPDPTLFWAGTDDGNVWRSDDAGSTWTDVSAGLPRRWVTRVTADPADANVAYVTLSGTTQGVPGALVYRSADRGATWTSIAANLPAAPANDLVIDPADPRHLFVATDLGVWWSRDRGATWSEPGGALPVGAVTDLTLHAATRHLVAWTHGRSAWSLDLALLPSDTLPPTPPARFALAAPWPNPARNAVQTNLMLAQNVRAEVTVYDAIGGRVSTLFAGAPGIGTLPLAWEGRDARGRRVRPGVYFLRAEAGGATQTRRVVLAP